MEEKVNLTINDNRDRERYNQNEGYNGLPNLDYLGNGGHNFNNNPPQKKKKKGSGGFILFLLYTVITSLVIFFFYNAYIQSRFVKLIEREQIRGEIILNKTDLELVEIPRELDFAGEAAPLDKFYVREAFERDYYILLGQDYQTLLYLKRSNKYFPYIEKKLKERGMPDDLKYIAVAESALVQNARSHAGAVGIWQFIPDTARQYGLMVNDSVDERLNYEKATRKALDFLEELHEEFGSWTLAAAAYNTGQGNIDKSLEVQEVKSYYDIYINAETSRYLYRILAIKAIMEDPVDSGFKLTQYDYFSWPETETIEVEGEIEDLNQWAIDQGSNLKEVKELNPWIVGYSLPEGDWEIEIIEEES
ncbi:MAG: transglycosylase SLT domain-containing protein [Candidatus Moranbacteria bacterium]|nr:transglycosylase SLT domain-containing protein [Candidatus Moranbacteria bacterium]